MFHAILHVLGLDDGSGPFYLLWSGIFADVTIFSAALGFYFKHTCHTKGCWRVGRHPVAGTDFIVCRRHHPDGSPTHEHILGLHRKFMEKRKQDGTDHHS